MNENRKAGVNVNKISDNIRKRALLGVAVFCITAIATIGALSMGGKDDKPSPDALVDLNESAGPGSEQLAEQEQENPEQIGPQQVADQPVKEEPQQTAEVTPEPVKEPIQTAESQEEPEVDQNTTVAQQPEKQPEKEPERPVQTADNTTVKVEEEPEQTEVLSPQLIAEQLKFDRSLGLLWPVQGEIIIPYSPDHGVYYHTLDQFGTSDAIVLGSAVGAEVRAAAKGVVVSIEEDVRTGTTVTLALGNNTSLVYGQLEIADLQEGDVVDAGECLGTVAEPTRYYVVEGPNLYFQVKEGDESVDPGLLLKEE